MNPRQSQLQGRDRLRGLLVETKDAGRGIAQERERFERLKGESPQVVTSPQLFPTPPTLAKRLAAKAMELAPLNGRLRVLEPSAGTGNLIEALSVYDGLQIVAVEINGQLCDHLRRFERLQVNRADFLECGDELGKFDLIAMNPPFASDGGIKHIQHARKFLRTFGRLVAICANGPRQQAKLQEGASEWHELPAGSFKESGTNVNTALVVYDA